MRVEDVTQANVTDLEDKELLDMKQRANQMYSSEQAWKTQLSKRLIGVSAAIPRDCLLESFSWISSEIERRGIDSNTTKLDRKLLRKKMLGLDTEELHPIIVQKSVVALSGEFVHSPRQAREVVVRIDAEEFGDERFTEGLEKRMVVDVMKQTGLPVHVRRDAVDLEGSTIPVYDLMLIPRERTDHESSDDLVKRLEKRSKTGLEESSTIVQESEDSTLDGSSDTLIVQYDSAPVVKAEHISEQTEAGKYSNFERRKYEEGVAIVYGVLEGKSKVQSVRFNTTKFTVSQAEEWLTEHKMKAVVQEAVVEKTEHKFIKSEIEHIVAGIVYAPYEIDSDGDFIDDPEEIWKALKSWAIGTGGVMKFMHSGRAVNTPVVECFQPDEDVKKNGETIPAGAWYISCYIPDQKLWDAILDGSVGGFSMAGSASGEIVEDD